jgi:mono/diheme cytochrome c family protein
VRPAIFTLLVSATLLAVSMALASEQKNWKDRADVYAELGKAPEKARNRANPLENDAEAVAAGRLLFEDHCAECHGDQADGGRKGPSLRAPEVQIAAPGAIFWLLTNGVVRKGMPVWSRLPEPQRWQLVRYLKSLGVAEPPRTVKPAAPAEARPKP